MKLIVGLGNPGKEYDQSRHNIGFTILDAFVQDQKWQKGKYGEFIKIGSPSKTALLIKPDTFMNLSGNAVNYYKNYYKIHLEDILVIQDDLDLEVGNYKLKINSSSGGHNGIGSLINSLGSDAFLRLKVGISKPAFGDTKDYVLKKISKTDQEKLTANISIYKNILSDFIEGSSADALMNKYN